MALLYISVDIS